MFLNPAAAPKDWAAPAAVSAAAEAASDIPDAAFFVASVADDAVSLAESNALPAVSFDVSAALCALLSAD